MRVSWGFESHLELALGFVLVLDLHLVAKSIQDSLDDPAGQLEVQSDKLLLDFVHGMADVLDEPETGVLEGKGVGGCGELQFVDFSIEEFEPDFLTEELNLVYILHRLRFLPILTRQEPIKATLANNLRELIPYILPQLSTTQILLLQ